MARMLGSWERLMTPGWRGDAASGRSLAEASIKWRMFGCSGVVRWAPDQEGDWRGSTRWTRRRRCIALPELRW